MRLLKFLFIVIIFIYSLVIFFPKERAINSINIYLKRYEIFINYADFDDKFLSANVKKLNIFYKNSKLATIDRVKIDIFLLNNSLYLKYFLVSNNFKDIVPNIKLATIKYNVKDIFNINLKANLVGAKIYGKIDLKEKRVIINLDANSVFKRKYKLLVSNFKKTKKGLVFEYNF